MAEEPSGRRPKRRCVASKAAVPSAVHYVGYVEDDETPEMIMRKFEELSKVAFLLLTVKVFTHIILLYDLWKGRTRQVGEARLLCSTVRHCVLLELNAGHCPQRRQELAFLPKASPGPRSPQRMDSFFS